jgi:tetratricopeptide (TPR) repeat protein
MPDASRPAEPTTADSSPPADTSDSTDPRVSPTGSLGSSPGEQLGPEWLAGFLTAGRPEVPGLELLEEIGRGGMGVVYRARDLTFGRDVAVKLMQDGYPAGSAAAARFLNEALITGRLQHPGVPPAYHVGTLPDGRPFLTMKLIAGRTLDALLADPAAEFNALGIFEAICQAVGYAHAHGVIHRDLKPHNVMVGSFGEVQVMDWGLAKVLPREGAEPREAAGPETAPPVLPSGADTPLSSDRTREGSVLGTPAYMPPEQAAGATDRVDQRADIFALGGILCFLLTGRPPYLDRDTVALRRAAAEGRTAEAFARLDGSAAEPGLIALAKRCLAADPLVRPADGRSVAAEVAALRAAAEERARRAELERAQAEVRAAEQRKRRRVQLALAGSVAALLIAAGAGLWWADRQAAGRAAEQRVAAARNREALAVALDQAEVGLRKPNPAYGEIDAALTQAEHRLRAEGATDEDRGRYEELARARRLLDRLDEIDKSRWAIAGGRFYLDGRAAREQYPLALRDYGLDVAAAAPSVLAEQVWRSPVASRLARTLEEWLLVGGGPDVLQLVNTLDPDPQRGALRRAYHRKDIKQIAASCAALDGRALPAEFALLVGGNTGTPKPEARRILAEAQAAHPDDFGLAITTAYNLPLERLPEAIKYYQIALAIRPDYAPAHAGLGAALLEQGDERGSVAALREAVRLDPAWPVARVLLGNALRRRKDYEGAAAAYREATRLDPKYVEAHNNLGNVLHDLKNDAAAADSYREALRLDPTYAPAYVGLGEGLRHQKSFAWAELADREAVRLAPNMAKAHTGLGETRRRRRDYAGSLAAYREALRIDPNYATAYAGLAEALRHQQDARGAAAACREAIRLAPDLAEAHTNLGNALCDLKDYAGAAAAYREALRLNTSFAPAHAGLGQALRGLNDHAGAAAACHEAIRIDPSYAPAYCNLGATRLDRNDPAGASDALREALRHDPTFVPAHNNLAAALYRQGKFGEAAAACREAIRLDPQFVAAHCHLGVVLLAQNDLDGAAAACGNALRRDPSYAPAHNLDGDIRSRRNDLDGAAAAHRRAVLLDPAYARAWSNLGSVLYRRQDYDGAAAACREAVRLDPSDALTHAGLGFTLFDGKDEDGALAAFEESVRLKVASLPVHAKLAEMHARRDRPADALRVLRAAADRNGTWAADPRIGLRFVSSRYAILASGGPGGGDPDNGRRALLRKEALDWLTADLAAWCRFAGEASLRPTVHATLERWLDDGVLAPVRSPGGLAELPAEERRAWEHFWVEVRCLRDATDPRRELLPPPRGPGASR